MDKGHKFVDKELEKLEKELKVVYSNALKEIEKEMKKWADKILVDKRASMKQKRTAINRLDDLYKKFTVELSNADKKAMTLMKEELSKVGVKNLEFMSDDIHNQLLKQGIDMTYTLYSDATLKAILQGSMFTNLAIEDLTNKSFIYNELKRQFATGMIKGESMKELANRVQKVINSNENRAMLIARTENTRVENEGRNEIFKNASKEGIQLQKQWIATNDRRVRKSHSFLNGEVVEMNDQFTNGLEYPGDPSGDPREVCNCRCTMRAIVEGVK